MSSEYHYNYNSSPGPGPGSPGPRPPRRGTDWEGVSWAIGVGLIFLWFPVGLFLTIAHSMGHDILGVALQALLGRRKTAAPPFTGKATRAGSAQTQRPSDSRAQQANASGAKAGPAADKDRFDGIRHADAGSVLKNVFGWLLVAFGLFMTAGVIFDGSGLWKVLSSLSIALGGGAMVLSGMFSRRKEAKFRRCMTISGDRGIVDLKKLSKTLGVDQGETLKTITEMVDRGYYGQRAYIDHERGLLVIDPEEMRDVYRREDEEKAAQKTRQERADAEKMNEYERYVERIRQADEDIADEVMSEKIRQMQNLTASIFAEVEAHPEKRSQIDRFMTYYLPTTLKLLDSYARIEAQGVSGENMAKAKADIEGIADTLVAGYKKQLDRLYRAEAMDIAGDVSVIENMLKRDGLSGSADFGQTMGGH